MRKHLVILSTILSLWACKKPEIAPNTTTHKMLAADISSYPEIAAANAIFYTASHQQSTLPDILKSYGINTIRLRLWVEPENKHCGFDEVIQFATQLKNQGFRIWLSLHYSDTWADPAHQQTPKSWQTLSYEQLKQQVYTYTQSVIRAIQPDYVQIGNEINSGFLHPFGHIQQAPAQFLDLLQTASKAVRDASNQTQIIVHYAGISGSDYFFSQIQNLDFDIIGLSYYPIWHGKSLSNLKQTLQSLSEKYHRNTLIAETAYPFTLSWNDWTNNIVGSNEQLILPDFPASEAGQKAFIQQIATLSTLELENCLGFGYWGAELIAWKGTQATDGSAWENQALFDFNHAALPVLEAFRLE